MDLVDAEGPARPAHDFLPLVWHTEERARQQAMPWTSEDQAEMIEQTVTGWDDWPEDVVERLRAWNAAYLLSFPQGPDYRCEGGCGRLIKAHERGNPVVRATKKAHGVPVCEDCLIAFARKYSTPPWLGAQAAYQTLKRKLIRQEAILEGTRNKVRRLKRQSEIAETYIDRLEKMIPDSIVAEIKDELRGKDRRP